MAPLPLIFLDFSGSDCKDQLREIRLPRLSFTTPVITIRLFRGPDIGETVKAQVRGMPVFSMAQVRKMDARGRKIAARPSVSLLFANA